MAFEGKNLVINKIGIIGSGQIGPDIALHFTKVLHTWNVPVVVVDIDSEALARGEAKLEKKVQRGVESGAFKPAQAEAMVAGVVFTKDYAALEGASLILEAASEDAGLKQRIFSQVEEICPADAVFASNSSHLEPEVIFAKIADKSRTLAIHYFFPAERNPLVEIIPGAETDPSLVDRLMSFFESIGKVPIRVASRYGYAVDPIFEGLFQAAALAVEAGLGTTREVDAVACRATGLTVGPFTAANLTGGNPITAHGLSQMTEKLSPWFKVPKLLCRALEDGKPWETPKRGEKIELPEERERKISEMMQGAYFGLVGQIIDSGIVDRSDLEMALELGLDISPPFQLMNEIGVGRALSLVENFAADQPGFSVPKCLIEQAKSARPWSIDWVHRRDIDQVAVVTIRRPKVQNALNADVYEQLKRHFTAIREDEAVQAAVLTSFGIKAFVSGADVNFLAAIKTPEEGFRTSEWSKEVGNLIEDLGKPVICAMGGPAIGGGNELAMCCTARICRKGLRMAVSQPEVNLGFIPGAGATQRLPRWIGLEKAAELLRTARPISSAEAVELGLIRQEVEGDLLDAAVRLAKQAAAGEVVLESIDKSGLETPAKLPDVDIAHFSRSIDAIMCRAILEGCAKTLDEGLRFESEMFAECCKTADMRIGIENFLSNGPRSRAKFTNA